MYFSNFSRIAYPFIINNKTESRVVVDITKNVRIISHLLSNISLFDTYTMKDGETIEFVSEQMYGTPDYYWTIMLANNRYDYINDFPIPQISMDQMIEDKYGLDNIYNIHHYETLINGVTYIVDENYGSNVVISGTVITELTDNLITGTETKFLSQIFNGDIVTNSNGIIVGTVASIINDSHATLVSSSKVALKNEILFSGPNAKTYPITNSDYEYSFNETKRVIKILSPTIILAVVKEMENL